MSRRWYPGWKTAGLTCLGTFQCNYLCHECKLTCLCLGTITQSLQCPGGLVIYHQAWWTMVKEVAGDLLPPVASHSWGWHRAPCGPVLFREIKSSIIKHHRQAVTISKIKIELPTSVLHCGRWIRVLQMMIGNFPVINSMWIWKSRNFSSLENDSVCSLKCKHLKNH